MMHEEKTLIALVGAMKSGTSHLHALLSTHPMIDGGIQKEGDFFVDNETTEFVKNFKKPGAKFVLDGSTAYTKPLSCRKSAEHMAAAIGQMFKDIKILYLVRDPIDRIVSQVNYMANNPQWSEPSFDHTGRDMSCYGKMLKPYEDNFDKAKILVITFEQLVLNEYQTLKVCSDFLGIETDFDLNQGYKHTTETKSNIERALLKHFQRGIHLFPTNIRKLGKRALRMVGRPTKLSPSESQLQAIHAHVRCDTLAFSEKYGTDLMRWQSFSQLEASYANKK